MAKLTVLALCVVLAGVLAEPPSSYLPPQARNSPSSVYGAPNGGFHSNGNGHGNGHGNGNGKAASFHSQRTGSQSFSYNSLHENQFGGAQKKSFGSGKFNGGFNGGSNGFGAPSQQYGAPSRSYGAPGRNGNGNGNGNGFGLSQQYGAPSNGFGLSQQYGAPSNGFGLSQQYGAPSNGFGSSAPSQQYGAPSFDASANGFNGHSNGFGASGHSNGFGASAPSQQYGAPSSFGGSGFSSYKQGSSFSSKSNGFGGRPKFGNGNGNGNGYAPAPVYGAPSGGYGYSKSAMDDDLAEPANYEYTYEVQAAEESGAEFGHQESREDEAARGVYHVLLPDGRTQIVEYEADEEGFRPQIRYEEPTGYPAARGPQGPY